MAIGFSEEQAINSLEINQNDPERAIDYLLA
jgi:hypothetical protein